MGNLPRERAAVRTGAQFVVQADVSQFYPSLYTHAVGWAIDPRLRDRTFYKKKKQSSRSLGAIIDQLLMNQQRKVSQGIPIGNDISFLLAEVVLAQVDKAMKVDAARSYRWFDDYELACDSREEAEQLLHRLTVELKKFKLRPNPAKTAIVELPRPTEDGWRHALTAEAQHGLRSDREMVRYFDLAFELRGEQPHVPVLSYAAGILFRLNKPTGEAGRVAFSALTQALLTEPGCAQKVFALLTFWRLNGFVLDQKAMTRTIDTLVEQHDARGVTSDVAWALQFCIENAIALGPRAGRALTQWDDNCVALQALYLHSLGLIPNGFTTKRHSALVAGADLDGPHWLLCYEAARHNFLSTSNAAVAGHTLFGPMLNAGVTFIRTALPAYASLIHPGGAPTWLVHSWNAVLTGAVDDHAVVPPTGPVLEFILKDAQPFAAAKIDVDELRLRLLNLREELTVAENAAITDGSSG
jgi:hypothetical protein